MNVGYVRLSRDDDKKNYVSIENQKLIIEQFAASMGIVIERWYEDDGVSGYIFDRPAFSQMRKDLDKEIDIVFAKDFSRIGRHNAKVLLFLDEFLENGKRLIVIDDDYDSYNPNDDIVGIKTWYNERYVKDVSKKIKRVINAKQKEGMLIIHVPYGYQRNEKDKKIDIIHNEADCIMMICDLYLGGYGYRKIAIFLTDNNIPTPSMSRHNRRILEGKTSKILPSTRWTDSMVKDILNNDFYIGNYRLHKRTRTTIHGVDKRVSKEEQYLFINHHPAIIDQDTFELIQEIKAKRVRSNYRGSKQKDGENVNIFGNCLVCKDCGGKLTNINRNTTATKKRYYICTTYNTKGKRYCSKSHIIEVNTLTNAVLTYIKLCRDTLCEIISTYKMKDFESEKENIETKRFDIEANIITQKSQLKAVFSQKTKDIVMNPDNIEIITESYDSLQNDILARIHGFEMQLNEIKNTTISTKDVKKKLKNALDIVDKIIDNKVLSRKDIEILIERIVVDENGMPEIELKYGLSNFISYSPIDELNKYENEIILSIMKFICEDNRAYTSARYLSEKLTIAGYKKNKKSVLPYINIMIEKNILKQTDNPLKPYEIIATKDSLGEYIQDLHCIMSTTFSPSNNSFTP